MECPDTSELIHCTIKHKLYAECNQVALYYHHSSCTDNHITICLLIIHQCHWIYIMTLHVSMYTAKMLVT